MICRDTDRRHEQQQARLLEQPAHDEQLGEAAERGAA